MVRFLSVSWALLALPCVVFAAEPVDYLKDVKPILAQHCYACHGPDKQRSGLRLDTAKLALLGGNSGPAIVPGKSADSRLIKAVRGAEGVRAMPPREPRLAAVEIAILQAWIDQGAKPPEQEKAEVGKVARTHWALNAPASTPPPAVKDESWIRNPIDRFILARLEKESLSPAAEAERVTLLRRLSLDLLGVPPTIHEIEDFLADRRPDAYERQVERLLQSPHYGERWGRHWLDQARYADSNGYSIDAARSIWRYRDWVIEAINRDLPFDQFTIEQLAGDLLPNATIDQKIATGFHRNTQLNQEGGIDVEQFRVESIVDRVNTTGAVFLGLTVGCCQCHDHKYDPLSQREYYQFFAFFNSADEPALELPTPEQVKQRERVRAQTTDMQKQLKMLDNTSPAKQQEWEKNLSHAEKKKLPAELRLILETTDNQRTAKQNKTLQEAFGNADKSRFIVAALGASPLETAAALHLFVKRSTLEKQIADIKRNEPKPLTTLVMQERKAPRETHVYLGGDFLRKGVPVKPDVPTVLHPLPAGDAYNRLDLARWLVDPKNPLTARVTVNRFWQNYFGTGLVETENDFGTQGTRPTHPELLDWLATEFIARGWSMKAMHRLIVTSATYRQSSRSRPDLAAIDADNRLLARQKRLRLEAEVVRDVSLAASGLLSSKIGGPPVFPPQPGGVYRFTQTDKQWRASTGPDRFRRGLYTHFWRSAPHPSLTVFDAPSAGTTCTRRIRSNTPLQALTLLNDQASLEYAQGLAARVVRESKPTDDDRLRFAFRLCLARQPSEREWQRLAQLLVDQITDFEEHREDAKRLAPAKLPDGVTAPQFAAWTMVARVLLNLDEFITRE